MRFVKRLELLVVVEGTAILKIYTPGPLKVRQIEPAIAMRKLIIDTKRSTRIAGPKGKSRSAANRAASALPPANGTEVGLMLLYRCTGNMHNKRTWGWGLVAAVLTLIP